MTRPVSHRDARARNIIIFMDHHFGQVSYGKLAVRFDISRARIQSICEREFRFFKDADYDSGKYLILRGYSEMREVEYYFRMWEGYRQSTALQEVNA